MDKRRIAAVVLIAAAAVVYGISPIDVIPDLLGPLGFADDAIAALGAVAGIVAILTGKRPPSSGDDTAPRD